MHAHRAEALHYHSGAVELYFPVSRGDLRHVADAPASGADFIQRDAAELSRQAHGPADLVPYPRHAAFVGAHVRAEDILLVAAQGASEGPYQPFLVRRRHPGIAEQY